MAIKKKDWQDAISLEDGIKQYAEKQKALFFVLIMPPLIGVL